MIQRKTCLGGIAAAAALLLAVTGCGKSYPAKNAAQRRKPVPHQKAQKQLMRRAVRRWSRRISS
ncbi:MAG: hypothetical protein ACLSFT_11665 [Ruminococcus callidus]